MILLEIAFGCGCGRHGGKGEGEGERTGRESGGGACSEVYTWDDAHAWTMWCWTVCFNTFPFFFFLLALIDEQ